MINHATRIENVVKDELAKACALAGIDKSEAGYVISGFGAVELVPDLGSQTATPMPVWAVTITLRSLLLGKPPIGGRLQIPGVLPLDEHFRTQVKRLVTEVDQARRAEFNQGMN